LWQPTLSQRLKSAEKLELIAIMVGKALAASSITLGNKNKPLAEPEKSIICLELIPTKLWRTPMLLSVYQIISGHSSAP